MPMAPLQTNSAVYRRRTTGLIFFFSPLTESVTAAAISTNAAMRITVILSPRKQIPNTAGTAIPPIIIVIV